uniref:Uncharacterized protein n=1 Tax=Rhizophora mucronata TaxID=61149 RepID=A0A2P2QI87_RHIMU
MLHQITEILNGSQFSQLRQREM